MKTIKRGLFSVPKRRAFSSKGQSEFVWIFSLIIGAMILFLAIYTASRVMRTGTYASTAEATRTLDTILNSFASMGSIASLTLSKDISMPYNYDIKIECSKGFEKMSMRLAEKGKPRDWTQPYSINNKYIFSNTTMHGKLFSAFSKPFKMPWRIDDMIYFISSDYCFIDAPESIESEMNLLNLSHVISVESSSQCGDAIRVCFEDHAPCSSKDVKVNYNDYSVEKNGVFSSFIEDASLYAAVFSDKQSYDCNMKRLMERAVVQADILIESANRLSMCSGSNIQASLGTLRGYAATMASGGTVYSSQIVNAMNFVKSSDNYICPIINK